MVDKRNLLRSQPKEVMLTESIGWA